MAPRTPMREIGMFRQQVGSAMTRRYTQNADLDSGGGRPRRGSPILRWLMFREELLKQTFRPRLIAANLIESAP